MMRMGFAALTLAACLAGASCGGSGADTSTGPVQQHPLGPDQVGVTNDAFSPSTITIKAGASVTWVWNSCSTDNYGYTTGTCVDHQVGFDDGTSSQVLNSGTYEREFDVAGTYPYHCLIHGVAMSGKVVVQ